MEINLKRVHVLVSCGCEIQQKKSQNLSGYNNKYCSVVHTACWQL